MQMSLYEGLKRPVLFWFYQIIHLSNIQIYICLSYIAHFDCGRWTLCKFEGYHIAETVSPPLI